MSVLQAIILGIVQGIAEFLPISSSGHLIFIPRLFGWTDQGLSFDVVVHLGSLVAVIYYFRTKLLSIIKKLFNNKKSQEKTLAFKLALSVFPAGIAGLLFSDYIETSLRSPKVIAIGLIFWGVMLYIAEVYQKQKKSSIKQPEKISWKQALFISLAQAIALIPGTSRSGITMTAGLFNNLSKTAAAEFSFLMSVPVIIIAGSVKMLELGQTGLGNIGIIPLITGFLAAAISGYFAISMLMKIVNKWSFKPFVIYRIIIGIILLIVFM